MRTLHGKVIFVGAGPGDPELLTLKAVRALQQADVVLCDRLVNTAITTAYAPQAVLITVGKQGRNSESIPQAEISALICHHANEGRTVVRLKGGDVSVFSNIAHELEALHQHNLAYEIIPGITAASGVAAAANMPLTARALALGVRFLTAYRKDAIPHSEWSNLAHCGDTLVFYMSGSMAIYIAARLLEAGMPVHTPLMVAENATMPQQKFTVSVIGECALQWTDHKFDSPALLIVGSCVKLHAQYAHTHFPAQPGQGTWHSLLPEFSMNTQQIHPQYA